MATRDVQFVIRARDEASRAFDGIAQAIEELIAAQQQLQSGSGAVTTDLGRLMEALTGVDKVARTISQGTAQAGSAFESQAAKVAELRKQLNALEEQRIASVRAQGSVSAAGAATGNSEEAATQIKAIEAAQAALEKQINRVTGQLRNELGALSELGAQQNNIQALATAFKEIAPNATAMREGLAAAQSFAGFAKEIGQSVEQEAAARERAAQALRDQAAAAAQEVHARNAQSGINQLLGVKDPVNGRAAASAAAMKAALDEADAEAKVTTELNKQAAAARAQIEINRQLGVSDPVKGAAAASAAVFEEQLNAAEAVAGLAQRIEQSHQQDLGWVTAIKERLNPLAGMQAQYLSQVEKANAALKAGLLTDEEHIQVLKMLNAEQKRNLANSGIGADGRPTLFGMTPWQMTNLSYQVNDVVSGFAMGQKPSQIVAQQLGQIIQLFPKLGSGIMAAFSNPYFLGAAGIFTAIAFAAKQAANEEDRIRAFGAILKANADGANYNAQALNDDVKALAQYNMSAADATTITKTFIKDGLNPAYITSFGVAAKDLSRTLGIDVKQAAQQVADAFTGGYDAIVKLDDATNFLTAAERAHIRALFDSGNAEQARKEAFDKFTKSQNDAAKQMQGPWTQAVEHLGQAWSHFEQSVGSSQVATSFENFLKGFSMLIDGIANGLDRLNSKKLSPSLIGLLALNPATFPIAEGLMSGGAPAGGSTGGGAATGGGNVNADLGARFAKDRSNIKAQTQADQKAIGDAKTEIQLQQELTGAVTDTQKARVAGEQAYREEMEKSGNKALAQLKQQAAQEQVITQIQQQRRQGLLTSAEQFLGKRENNRQDAAVLEGLFNQYGIKTPQGGSVDPQKLAWCAAFVNAMLASKGLPTTGSLAAASFKNYGKGVSLEEAQPGDIVVLDHGGHVGLFVGYGPNGTVRILGGNQGKQGQGAVSISNFKRSAVDSVRRVGDIASGYDTQDTEAAYTEQKAQAQDSFNEKLQFEAAQRKLVIDYMKQQLGMSADQLLASQRQEAIDQAIAQKVQEAQQSHGLIQFDGSKDKNGNYTGAQAKEIAAQVGATFDLQHATEAVNNALKEQQDLRSALLTGIQNASQRGDAATVTALTAQLNQMTPALEAALTKAEDFYKGLQDSPEKQAALEGFRQLREAIKDTGADLAQLNIDRIGKQISDVQALQSALRAHVNNQQMLGNGPGASAAMSALVGVNAKLKTLQQTAIDAWKAVLADPTMMAEKGLTPEGVQAIIQTLQDAQDETALMGRQFMATGMEINSQFAEMATQGVDSFFAKVGQGEGIFQALKESFLQFAADFLKYIAEMIIKQIIFNAISGGSSAGGSGGIGGFLSGLFGAHHGGGMAGSPSMFRAVNPVVFAGATRYHTGGLVGLQPDEVPAILKRGEEVLTTSDARHRNNLGGRGAPGGQRGLRQILAMGDDEIAQAIAGAAGEEVWITHLKRNRSTVRQLISDNQ